MNENEERPFYDVRLREEEVKHRVAADWFAAFDCTRVIGNIDFCVDIPATELALGYAAEPALWAEAKAGVRRDIVESFVQLILTVGRARMPDEVPPLFLGAFDAAKIAFIPYNAVLDVLGANDFNWNVTPSDHETREFRALHALVAETIARERMQFDFARDAAELRRFIRANFRRGRADVSKLRINKNNFYFGGGAGGLRRGACAVAALPRAAGRGRERLLLRHPRLLPGAQAERDDEREERGRGLQRASRRAPGRAPCARRAHRAEGLRLRLPPSLRR